MNTLIQFFVSFVASGKSGTDTGSITKWASEAVCALAHAAGILPPDSCIKQKGVKRFAQALNFAYTGDLQSLDRVNAAIVSLCMIGENGQRIGFDQLHYALTAKGKDGTKHIPHLSGARLRKVIGSVSPASIESQVSRSVGKGGMFTALGITVKGDAHGFTIANREHPFVTEYARRLVTMPEGDFCNKFELSPPVSVNESPATQGEGV